MLPAPPSHGFVIEISDRRWKSPSIKCGLLESLVFFNFSLPFRDRVKSRNDFSFFIARFFNDWLINGRLLPVSVYRGESDVIGFCEVDGKYRRRVSTFSREIFAFFFDRIRI